MNVIIDTRDTHAKFGFKTAGIVIQDGSFCRMMIF